MGVCQLIMSDPVEPRDAKENKILQHWDLYSCGAPKWSTTCNNTKNSFDVIMIRDAFQHIAISKAGRYGTHWAPTGFEAPTPRVDRHFLKEIGWGCCF